MTSEAGHRLKQVKKHKRSFYFITLYSYDSSEALLKYFKWERERIVVLREHSGDSCESCQSQNEVPCVF